MLLHSLHRHVAHVYSKKFALHCFKPYSTSCTKILHILKTFCKSHSTLFKTKQDFHRTAVLFERKYCKSWCCTCFKTEKKIHLFKKVFAPSMESTVGSCYTFWQECCTLCKQESACSNAVKHMFQWMCHFIDKGFARFEGPFDSKIALFSKQCCSNLKRDSILQNSILHFPTGMLWFLKWFSTYIGGFSLKLESNATHLSKNATIVAKGCCIHWGIVFFVQSHFTSRVCKFVFPSWFVENILPSLSGDWKCVLYPKKSMIYQHSTHQNDDLGPTPILDIPK